MVSSLSKHSDGIRANPCDLSFVLYFVLCFSSVCLVIVSSEEQNDKRTSPD